METFSFRLEGEGRRFPIAGDVCVPEGEGPAPVVAIAHGWLGWKDRSFLPYFAEGLAQAGFVAVSFSFSASGVPTGRDEVLEDEKFAVATFSRQVDDLERIVTAIFERVLPGGARFDIYRIGVLGYDAGGATALLEARRDSRVKALVVVNAPVRLESVLPDALLGPPLPGTEGERRFRDPRTNRLLRVGPDLFRDLRLHAAELDVLAAARDLAQRYLVIQGGDDTVVPVADAKALFFANSERADIEVLPRAGHELGASHPMADPGEAVRVARAAAIRFFGERLR